MELVKKRRIAHTWRRSMRKKNNEVFDKIRYAFITLAEASCDTYPIETCALLWNYVLSNANRFIQSSAVILTILMIYGLELKLNADFDGLVEIYSW